MQHVDLFCCLTKDKWTSQDIFACVSTWDLHIIKAQRWQLRCRRHPPLGLACRQDNIRCFKCGSFNHFKCECPDRARTAGKQQASARQKVGDQSKKRKQRTDEKKSKRDIQGNFHSKNWCGGPPQAPFGNQKAVQGAQGLPIQEDLYLSSSE